jgi:hypothetical protein
MKTPRTQFIPAGTTVRFPGFAALVEQYATDGDAIDALYDFEKEQRALRIDVVDDES